MRPRDIEPVQEELENMLDDEERQLLANPEIPEDVKAEVVERLERFHDEDLERQIADEPAGRP